LAVTFMPLDEILSGGWQISPPWIAAPAQFVSHVFRNVLRPSLFSVEGDSGAGKDRQESAAAFSCPILC
jgi:hypothetical protein